MIESEDMTSLLYFIAQSTTMDLSALRFRGNAAELSNSLVGAAIVLVLIIIAGIFAFFYIRSRRRTDEIAEQREEARLRLMVSELNLGRSEIQLLQTLMGGGDTADLLELMESREMFEDAVQRFHEANPDDPVLRRVSALRQRLEYGFNNIRNPFVDTRMLAPGTRLRCRLRLAKRDVSFLTTVLGINENQFIIRPPTSKGKPVGLGNQSELQFRVAREHDAEYEFTCPVEGQLPTGMRPVLCGHTRAISRLLFRNADRIQVEIPTEFFVIRQEIAGERATGGLRAMDSQYRFDGSLRDISIGGALVVAEGPQERVHEGDMVVFRLPDAQIKDDLVAQAVGMMPRDDGATQIHLQFLGLKELNRLKLGKFLVGLKQSGATYSQGTKLAQQPPQVTS
jgi:c-di-GMP-binding flagellar brake protein YcgR